LKKIKSKLNQLNLPLNCSENEISNIEESFHKEIKLMVKYFKKYGSIARVALATGKSFTSVKRTLLCEFDCSDLTELRQKIVIKKVLSNKKISKLLKAKETYEKCGTLQKAADELNLTRERVRQLLNQGEEHKLYKYEIQREVNHKERLIELKSKFTRAELIREIKRHSNKFDRCLQLEVSQPELDSLLEFFNIDYQEYSRLSKMGKCLEAYSFIVDSLGHHPTTTEMTQRKEWRNLWHRITRLWGRMENFRNEYGIEKPKHRLHPNTIKSYKKMKLTRIKNREEKVNKILTFVKENSPVSSNIISIRLGIKRGSLFGLIKYLIDKEAIVRIGTGNKIKYTAR